MARIASEALIERLADWGVDTVFGLPGDGINGIMEGLRRHQDKVRFFPVHHGVRHPEPFVNYAATATANGAFGVKVVRPGELPGAIREALSHDGPALVDVNVNPEEPPLPGKIEYEQAKKFAEAFLRGQPRKATIATTLFRDKIDQLKG